MSLESQISALVSAANKLTSEVAAKMQGIDQKVDKATQAVPEAIQTAAYTRFYVDSVNGNDGDDGSTLARAKKTIASAVRAVPDGFIARIDLSPGEYLLDQNVNVAGKVISINGRSQSKEDFVIRGMPYFDENTSGVTYTYSTGFNMGLRGVLVAVGVTLKTAYVQNASSPQMRAYTGSLISTASSQGIVLLQHTNIEVNHGPFMHQHASGSFGTCDLRMREVSVAKGNVSGSLYEGRRYLMDQIGEDSVPYELYGTSVSISGFSSWAEAVRLKHENITSNLI